MSTPLAEYPRFSRPRFLSDVELVSVSYRDRSFPEHSHEEYVVGAITAGAETLTVKGKAHLAEAGSALRLRPGEVHSNSTVGANPLRYSVIYMPAHVLLTHLGDEAAPRLVFTSPVTREPDLYKTICAVYRALETVHAGKMEQESALSALVSALAGDLDYAAGTATPPRAPLELARRYIDDHFANNFGLADLSQLIGLSTFHMARAFKSTFGLSPMAYRNQRRVFAARRMLLEGQATAQIALELGYADQSHFSRQFQSIMGVSPRRYAKRSAGNRFQQSLSGS